MSVYRSVDIKRCFKVQCFMELYKG